MLIIQGSKESYYQKKLRLKLSCNNYKEGGNYENLEYLGEGMKQLPNDLQILYQNLSGKNLERKNVKKFKDDCLKKEIKDTGYILWELKFTYEIFCIFLILVL